MKLIRCHIENFGKLNNQDISFTEGCNLFFYENGWGKSSLAAFLKVMLYGFSNERSRDEYANERKRYRPWQGGVYGGSLTFETEGRCYTVTRIFGQKEKEDRFSLREEETELESSDFSASLGEELFHLDRLSFEKSVFLSQNDCGTGVTDRIHANLGNLMELTNDMTQYEQAEARLTDELNRLSPLRKTGLLYKMKEQIGILEEKLRMQEQREQRISGLEGKKKKMTKEYRMLREEQERLLTQQSTLGRYKDLQIKKEQYKNITQRWNLWNTKAEEYKNYFQGNLPDKEELESMIDLAVKMPEAADFSGMMSLETARNRFGTKGTMLCLSAGVGFLLLGVFLLSKQQLLGLAVILAGVCLLFFSRKEELSRKEKLSWTEKREEDSVVRDYILSAGFDPKEQMLSKLLEMKNRLEEYEHAVTEAKQAEADWDYFEEHENIEEICGAHMEEADSSLEQLAGKIRKNQMNMEENHRKKLFLEQELQREYRDMEEAVRAEEELLALKEEYAAKTLHYERIRMTREYLAKAKAAFALKYKNPLTQAFGAYYEMISGESAQHFKLDAQIRPYEEAEGMLRESRYMSAGKKDLIGICLRMAMIDIMYKQKKPFLILDDPFVNLDNEKVLAGLDFIEGIAKEYQVIYFTCHESRMP